MAKVEPAPSTQKPAGEGSESQVLKDKKRELLEMRILWKFVDEEARRRTDERKVLKERIDALAAEVRLASGATTG